MKRDAGTPVLSAIFVDYDNIYLSLKRKSEEAAKRFAKDAGVWLRGIETGRLISQTNGVIGDAKRRVVLNRCYGNPVPRRNQSDNSTDMNSFPFVRHHFLRSGFEVVDCPPLTAQLKNSADIRMVMDMRDYLTHDTYFDEFIILSGDADFTPVLHRLRQHARKTVVFANDFTAAPYTAICDGEIRESDLIALLLENRQGNEVLPHEAPVAAVTAQPTQQAAPIQITTTQSAPMQPSAPQLRLEDIRQIIIAEVVAGVRAAAAPVPLEALADRAIRALGHDRTIATSWAGAGSFRELLRQSLPADVRLSENPPYYVYDPARHLIQAPALVQAQAPIPTQAPQQLQPSPQPMPRMDYAPEATIPPQLRQALPVYPTSQQLQPQAQPQPVALQPAPVHRPAPLHPSQSFSAPQPSPLTTRGASNEPVMHRAIAAASPPPQQYQPAGRGEQAPSVQQSIARIHEACQAPPLAPPEYRALFEVMAQELSDNGLAGAQTLTSITERAQDRGINVRREDVQFVLDAVSEADPWYEQGASAVLFAGRFRNFVVARCREQGLNLSADELDLVDAWFTGGAMPSGNLRSTHAASSAQNRDIAPPVQPRLTAPSAPAVAAPASEARGSRWWSADEARQQRGPAPAQATSDDDFPRIIRTRQRG
jgi:hypothetical protein